MYRNISLILIILLSGQVSRGQFKDLAKLIPKGFTILDSASGDITKDGVKDLIVILRNNYENINTDTTRPLLLLQGNTKKQYKLIARNDSVVLCMGCGGAYGDPYQEITIKNGYFSIEHLGGSSWRWTRIITFKYKLKTKQFILSRDAGESWHVSNPNKTKETVFNKEDFNKLPFDKFSYNKIW